MRVPIEVIASANPSVFIPFLHEVLERFDADIKMNCNLSSLLCVNCQKPATSLCHSAVTQSETQFGIPTQINDTALPICSRESEPCFLLATSRAELAAQTFAGVWQMNGVWNQTDICEVCKKTEGIMRCSQCRAVGLVFSIPNFLKD